VEFQELADISLVDLGRHPEIASRIEPFLLQEKTVAAIEIAGRSRRFGHDMKGLGNITRRHV
jgi:hypothetical protein